MSTKEFVGFFKFYLNLELFAKIEKDLVSTHSFFTLLLIIQDLNKIKKCNKHFVDITEQKNCAKFQQKSLNPSWRLPNFSTFHTKILVSWK